LPDAQKAFTIFIGTQKLQKRRKKAVAELLVPVRTDSQHAEQPPAPEVLDGRFSFSKVTILESGQGFYSPYDQYGNPLSPMETGTNVVLPIVAQSKGRPNRHHAYFYECHYSDGDLALRALRYSRLQKVSRGPHKDYHKQYHGTSMPANETETVAAVILNSAGYIANLGVCIDEDGTSIEEITPSQRDALRKPQIFSVERSEEKQAGIGRFLMQYALRQRLDHVKQSQIEEFLELTPRKMAYDEGLRARKLHLGMRLTNIAIGLAIDPVAEDYRMAHRKGALRKYTPNTAWEWAKRLVKDHETDYLESLEDRLIAQYGAAA
jgi:hypothetical protein